MIFGQEGALRDAIERGGGSWGISTRAFVFHFKGATVHKRRLSLWSNELPSKEPKRVTEGDEATDIDTRLDTPFELCALANMAAEVRGGSGSGSGRGGGSSGTVAVLSVASTPLKTGEQMSQQLP